ncbi:hypothetical protein CRG98_021745 [Punica granatum]|uniref:Uncharacterized protein n=1 Tax=Punica granatum TaxID=22663 RepID=A0A2I0JNI6_PUNGR|nr:hypothetical protein CRG98_021745 [Punica granatum]
MEACKVGAVVAYLAMVLPRAGEQHVSHGQGRIGPIRQPPLTARPHGVNTVHFGDVAVSLLTWLIGPTGNTRKTGSRTESTRSTPGTRPKSTGTHPDPEKPEFPPPLMDAGKADPSSFTPDGWKQNRGLMIDLHLFGKGRNLESWVEAKLARELSSPTLLYFFPESWPLLILYSVKEEEDPLLLQQASASGVIAPGMILGMTKKKENE